MSRLSSMWIYVYNVLQIYLCKIHTNVLQLLQAEINWFIHSRYHQKHQRIIESKKGFNGQLFISSSLYDRSFLFAVSLFNNAHCTQLIPLFCTYVIIYVCNLKQSHKHILFVVLFHVCVTDCASFFFHFIRRIHQNLCLGGTCLFISLLAVAYLFNIQLT